MNLKTLGVLTFSFLIMACSDVGFKSVPSQTCQKFNNNKDQSCAFGPKGNDYTVSFRTGQIDILFVNDNSRSMAPEQSKMANAFSGFLNKIANLDYQIAMVTTDIDAGNLLTFKENSSDSGVKVLKRGVDANKVVARFQNTVQRQETIDCDISGGTNCPSNDERGIYAMNLVVQKNQSKFLRNGAHLAVVILSDEDERGQTIYDSSSQNYESAIASRPLEDLDLPETFVENFTDKFSTKDVSVHSVIVKPGDSSCLNAQEVYLGGGKPSLKGFYGNLYQQLSYGGTNGLGNYGQIINGSSTSICDSTYYNKLDLIGSLAASNAQKHKVKMVCAADPADINVTSTGGTVTYTLDTDGRTLLFDNTAPGIEVTVTYTCPNTI